MKKNVVIVIFMMTLVLSACAEREAFKPTSPELVEIRLPMGFVPNIQFAPFYVAVEKGYYREVGLEVTFDYKRETDGLALVGAGEIPFSVVSGEQVPLARAKDLPVVYVMAWYKDYPVAVIASEDQRITEPEDLEGRTVGLPGLYGANYVGLRALLGYVGLKENDLRLDSIGYNQVEALVSDQVEAVVGYLANEPVQLRSQGYDIDVIAVADYVQLVSNGLITNQQTLNENPDLVRDMVQATLKGIQFTVENPEKAYEITHGYVEGLEEADREVQMEVLRTSIDLYQVDPYGKSEDQSWENMVEILRNMGLLEDAINVEAMYTNEFIKE
ncbi:MAG: ABC transporter substrate-binding protein [Anaerolineales bacterium]